MKTVTIGGQSRDIGKTSLACGIIAAFPRMNWTAVKITGFGPEEYFHYGTRFALSEEQERGLGTDSSRFLAAGARRSFWLRVPLGQLGPAMPVLRAAVNGASHLIVESNRVLEFIEPDVYLLLLDPARPDFKMTARRFFHRADAYVVVDRGMGDAVAPAGDLTAAPGKPRFRVSPTGPFITPAIIDFLKERLKEEP